MESERSEQVRVLLVDGDPARAAGHASALEQAALIPVLAETLEQAYRMLDGNPDFCLILLDADLSGSEGIEMFRRMQESSEKSGVPFLLVSSRFPSETQFAKGYALGAVDYIVTPIPPQVLLAKARVFADLYRKSKQVNRLVAGLQGRLSEKTEALRGSEERFRLMVENIRDYAIFMLDLDGRISSWNPGVERFLGYAEDEFVGREGTIIFTPEDIRNGDAEAEFRTALQTGTALDERWHVRKDGSRFWASGFLTAMRDRKGNTVGFTKIMRDFTEIRKAEEQIRQAQKLEAVARLAGGVAHDFNNLLTTINGYCDLLLDGTDPADARHAHLKEIRNAGARAAVLTKQLLAYGREQQLNPKVLEPNALLNSLESMVRSVLGESVRLEMELDPAVGRIRADQAQVEQVILNLVLNAKDAMPGGGVLRIRSGRMDKDGEGPGMDPTLPPGRYAVLTVSDTGEGMSEDVLARIFEPFFTTRKTGRTSGLGLPTAHGIMKQSGGSITVESEPGKGSTFRVFFPWAEAPESRLAHQETGFREP